MVAETQRVRVRLLWDDQKMRQTIGAAAGLDKLGKTMAAAYGLDRLGKTMAAAYGLDRLGNTMAAAHRERMRSLFDTKKLVGPMFGGELQRAAQAMAEAHQAVMRPAFDASKLTRVGLGGENMRQMTAAAAGLDRMAKIMADAQRVQMRPVFDASKLIKVGVSGEIQRIAQAMADAQRVQMRPLWDGEKMRQTMAAAAGLDKMAKIMADSVRVRMPPLFNTQKMVGPMFGGEFQRIAQVMADAYRAPPRPMFDARGVIGVAQSFMDATMAVPSNATTGSLAVVGGSVPAKVPLFPGLMNPWQQVRYWDLQNWFTFLGFLVAVAALLVAMGQSCPQVGLSLEDLEKAIRVIQENAKPNSGESSKSTSGSTTPKSTRSLDGEKGGAPTVRPSPTTSAG
jgi:hypothetical protein